MADSTTVLRHKWSSADLMFKPVVSAQEACIQLQTVGGKSAWI
mgnify:FL=1